LRLERKEPLAPVRHHSSSSIVLLGEMRSGIRCIVAAGLSIVVQLVPAQRLERQFKLASLLLDEVVLQMF
jgi:hypothetical protein